MLKEFKKFILRGNVVDLAIAVVIGAAFGAVVTSMVKDLITPLIAAFGGQPDFSQLSFTINGSHFMSFVILSAVVFFFVVQPLNKLMGKLKPAEEAKAPSERNCPECLAAIPLAAKRCMYCTSTVKPVSKKK